MPHFFVKPDQVNADEIIIIGTDVNHLQHVLRLKPGAQLTVCDGTGQKYWCTIKDFVDQKAVLTVGEVTEGEGELPSRIHLFQGLPKGDKMEWIIQKGVELGVAEIIPVENQRSVTKLDAKKSKRKVERWNAIAESAAKQSIRSVIPPVREVMSFWQALAYAQTLDTTLLPYELAQDMSGTRKLIEAISPGTSVGIFIGPEGGFTEMEVALAQDHHVIPITLGKRILRTETAGLTVLSILMYHLER